MLISEAIMMKQRKTWGIAFPISNILVNGAGGIAVGMANSIPPYSSEVIDATKAFINNKEITISQLMKTFDLIFQQWSNYW